MALKKTDDASRNIEIFEEELKREEILIDAELHNPYEIEEEEEVADEVEETDNDYLLEKDRSRRVIKPPQIYGYADLISFSLICASEVLDKNL